jgi:hypothetical protein
MNYLQVTFALLVLDVNSAGIGIFHASSIKGKLLKEKSFDVQR